jgi:hypothetical protein
MFNNDDSATKQITKDLFLLLITCVIKGIPLMDILFSIEMKQARNDVFEGVTK